MDNQEISRYVQQKPWLCLAAATGLGYWLGSRPSSLTSAGVWVGLQQFFQREINDLKSYALSQAMGVAKEAALGAVPESLGPQMGKLLDRAMAVV